MDQQIRPEALTLTVEEAAHILGIGRTAAYALATEWRATGGKRGLPVLELGRSLRVPKAALASLLGVSVADLVRTSAPNDSDATT